MVLVEECEDLVAFLESFDAFTDGFNSACPVGRRDHTVFLPERILAFGYDKVTVVERSSVD